MVQNLSVDLLVTVQCMIFLQLFFRKLMKQNEIHSILVDRSMNERDSHDYYSKGLVNTEGQYFFFRTLRHEFGPHLIYISDVKQW